MNWLEINYKTREGYIENYSISQNEIKFIRCQGRSVLICFLDFRVFGYLKEKDPDFFDAITSCISNDDYFSVNLFYKSEE